MPLEYEYRYKTFNKPKIIKKLNELGAKYENTYLFKVQVFIHPTEKPGTYIIQLKDDNLKC